MGLLSFPKGARIVVDACLLIYYVENIEPYASQLQPLFESAVQGDVEISTSELSLLEVWIKPFQTGDNDLIEHYSRLLFWTNGLTMNPITRDVLEQAARLRGKYKSLRTPDAIHLASAMTRQCGAFVTNDAKLKIVSELPVIILHEV